LPAILLARTDVQAADLRRSPLTNGPAAIVGADSIASEIPENTSILLPGSPTFAAGDAAALAHGRHSSSRLLPRSHRVSARHHLNERTN